MLREPIEVGACSFSDAKSFNQYLLKSDVFRVTSMVYTFNNVASFNQDLPKWGV